MNEMKNILILGAHPDDVEFGMGGTLARIQRLKKSTIRVVIFSNCDESLPSGFETGTLTKECIESLSIYGLDSSEIKFYDFKVRNFNQSRQEILDVIIQEYRSAQFDTVFFPSSSDTHQDHWVVSHEAMRACKKSTMLGYEMPWNTFESKKNFYFEISDKDLQVKINSIKKYKSQGNRQYASTIVQESVAISGGVAIGKEGAEGFELIRGIFPL